MGNPKARRPRRLVVTFVLIEFALFLGGWRVGAGLAAAVLPGFAGATPATAAPAGLAGRWVGTWKSAQFPANGHFSATLSRKPAWWGGAEIVGTLEFGGDRCVGGLKASGTYYRGREYLLTAKAADGAVRLTATVAISTGAPRSLSGHYDVAPSGACGADSGTLKATAR